MTDGSRKSSTELPQEPMIVGAVGAALCALDRARKTPAGATT